jgi:uncharacterized protein YoxC
MGETEHITVAETSDGPGGTETAGEEVSLPVVELLTGRGFITGKSGSGKSNSASVVAEKLLDSGFGLFIVDIDGEYYGLKEEYEILHAGADEECDIQVTSEHAEKLASLALEQNVPVILDVSSYLDESEAEELLTDVARSLFAKAKKQKQPFLLLIEEVHEYIPEQGAVGECGKMLIKIGKRGRKHGLGICGISQRPADVKKDFITQCDWLLWHRLTWNNDTTVVRRILDGEYASAVEDLGDGEGFLVTDWSDAVRRVQFYRKRTFDAGATPGLEDVERPDLKSVSDDLVSELQSISDETEARTDRIAELEADLEQKEARIEQLESELAEARDLQQLAQQFVDALVERVEDAGGRVTTESETHATGQTDGGSTRRERAQRTDATRDRDGSPTKTVGDEWHEAGFTDTSAVPPDDASGDTDATDHTSGDASASDGAADGGMSFGDVGGPGETGFGDVDSTDETAPVPPESPETVSGNGASGEESDDGFSAEEILSRLEELPGRQRTETDRPRHTAREEIEITLRSDAEFVGESPDTTGDDTEESEEPDISLPEEEPLAVRKLKADIGGLETKTREMLVFYREHGPATAPNAHFAAGGDGERVQAYARNRTLRTHDLIEHVGRGHYDYRLRRRLADELSDHVDDAVLDAYVAEIEAQILDT